MDVSIKSLILFFFIAITAACGGGSGGGSGSSDQPNNAGEGQAPTPPKELLEQRSSFENKEEFKVFVGDEFVNPLSQLGKGGVVYSSSDESVAKVDDKGNVSVISPGKSSITASIKADDVYKAAELSFSLAAINREYKVRAWVGDLSSKLELLASNEPLEFYVSRDEDCDLDNYATCDSGELISIADNEVSQEVAAFTKSESAAVTLKFGNHQATSGFSAFLVEPRAFSEVVEFKGKLWMVGGGFADDYDPTAHVLSSVDGVNWIKVSEEASFEGRREHSLISFADKLWVIAGITGPVDRNDVWSSENGVDWVRETVSAAFSGRGEQQVVVKDDKLWLIGGAQDGTVYSDIWSSEDGINWNLEVEEATFGKRRNHQIVKKGGEYWLFGGTDEENVYNDIWMSTDLKSWQRVTEHAIWAPRQGHQVVVYQNKFVLTGGQSSVGWNDSVEFESDVWESSDGRKWNLVTDKGQFGAISMHEMVAYHNKLFLVSGVRNIGSPPNGEIWSSENNKNWRLESNQSDFDYRARHKLVSFEDKIFLIGGERLEDLSSRNQFLNDIWSSQNGLAWKKESADGGFPARSAFDLVFFSDALWIFGGRGEGDEGNTIEYRDIWRSEDGVNWAEQSAENIFLACNGHDIVELKGKLWMISGGKTGEDACDPQLWSSVNGVDWVNETEGSGLPSFSRKRFISHQGKIWAVGRKSEQADVWSFDGANPWRVEVEQVQCATDEACMNRRYHYLTKHNDKLFIIAGEEPESQFKYGFSSDVLSSENGKTWELVSSEELNAFSMEGDVIVHDGAILQIGGRITSSQNNKASHGSLTWSTGNGIDWKRAYQHTLRFEK